MNSREFAQVRFKTGLGVVEFGGVIGYTGSDATVSRLIRSFEDGTKPIPLYIQRLVAMYRMNGVPSAWMPQQRARALAK